MVCDYVESNSWGANPFMLAPGGLVDVVRLRHHALRADQAAVHLAALRARIELHLGLAVDDHGGAGLHNIRGWSHRLRRAVIS